MLVIGRVPARFLLPLLAAAAVSAPLVIGLLRPYQVERLGSFLVGAHESPTGSGWAVRQAHIAVGSGALFGRTDDPLRGLRAQYLPERDTDLALASLVGQWGLVAGAGAVLAAIVLVWRLALASRAPRTPHGALVGGGLAILLGVETVVSVGGNLGLLPLAGVPFPLLSYGGTALVVHLAAIGVVLAVRRDGARRRLWALPRWRNPRPRLVRLTALGLSVLLISFGLYGWRLQSTQGEALLAAGQEQMTRCVRLPAPRGAITDRHDAPLAVNAADVGSGVDRVLVVPALLRARPADVDRLAELTGRPREDLHAQLDRGRGHHAVAAGGRRAPRAPATRSPRPGSPACSWSPEPRRAYPTGALLGPVLGFAGVATPEDEAALARPAAGRGRRPGRPRAAVRRGAARDQRAAVPVRRPEGRAGRARRAAGPRARRRPAALDRPGPAAAAGRQPGRGRARTAPAPRQDRRRRRDGPEVGPGPRHREHPVVRQQRLRAAGRRRRAAGPGRRAGLADARARDPGRRAARVDVQARGGRGEPGPPGLRARAGPSPPGPTSPTAATPSATGSRWAR